MGYSGIVIQLYSSWAIQLFIICFFFLFSSLNSLNCVELTNQSNDGVFIDFFLWNRNVIWIGAMVEGMYILCTVYMRPHKAVRAILIWIFLRINAISKISFANSLCYICIRSWMSCRADGRDSIKQCVSFTFVSHWLYLMANLVW